MFHVIQIFCVVALTVSVFSAERPLTIFYPSDPHLDVNSPLSISNDDSQSETVTTLGPHIPDSQEIRDGTEDAVAPEVSVPDLKPETPQGDSESESQDDDLEVKAIPDSLRDALTRSGLDPNSENPLVTEAKAKYIATWNVEALKQDLPFLIINQVWPDVGMMYMPTVNEMTNKIQKSTAVRDAAKELKLIWETYNQGKTASITSEGEMYEALASFFTSWNAGARDELKKDSKKSDEVVSSQLDGRPSDKGPVVINQGNAK